MTSAELLEFALATAEAAGRAILPHFRAALDVEDKGGAKGYDPVTVADHAAEAIIRAEIARVYPSHGIRGEEHGIQAGASPYTWVIDPIDGTRSFILGQMHWATLIAVNDGTNVVAGVAHQPYVGESFLAAAGSGAEWRRGSERRRLASRRCGSIADAVVACTDPKMFREPGERAAFDRVSTRAVARKVGCTPPALYLHFPDKASLIYAACDRQFDKLGAVLHEAMDQIDDPVERLRAASLAYVRFALDHPEEYRVMMLDLSPSSMYEATLEEMATSPGFEAIVDTVRDGIERGIFKPVDPMVAALMMWAAIHGLVSLRLVKGGLVLPDIEVLLESCLILELDGLRATEGPGAPVHSQA